MKHCPYDAIYKAFWSDKSSVRRLLLDFVKLPFMSDLDFESLTPFKAHYAPPAFSRHENEPIWLARLKGRKRLIFLMLEVQNRSEKWMALRIANYSTLLLMDLISHPCEAVSLWQGLPPILPIVFYNGDSRWQAAFDLSDLYMQMPAGLLEFQNSQKYYLLDIKHLASELVQKAKGRASFLVSLERAAETQGVLAVMRAIIQTCEGPEYDHFRRLIYNFLLFCLELQILVRQPY